MPGSQDQAVSMPVPPALSHGRRPTSGDEPQQVPRLIFGTAKQKQRRARQVSLAFPYSGAEAAAGRVSREHGIC